MPEPDKPKSKTNNRKKTFDAMCRELLLDICDNRKLYLDKMPEYGGRDYLEKQDYILMKQKEQMAAQKEQIDQQEQLMKFQMLLMTRLWKLLQTKSGRKRRKKPKVLFWISCIKIGMRLQIEEQIQTGQS